MSDMVKQILLERWQIHVGKDPRTHKFKVVNSDWRNKPKQETGLWLSSYDPKIGSGWNYFCETDYTSFGNGRGTWKCILAEDTTLIYIDTWKDWERIVERYLLTTYSNSDWRKKHPNHTINFELLHEDGVDGINLSETGQWDTRWLPKGLEREVGMFGYPTLYGWDCESTVLFTNKIIHTEKITLPTWEEDPDDPYVTDEEKTAIHVERCERAHKENPYR